MAKYHIILGNGQGCGSQSSHATKESAGERADLLDANGHGPCRVWEEQDTSATVGGVTVDLASAEYAAWYAEHYGYWD